jgi:pyruvate kinase
LHIPSPPPQDYEIDFISLSYTRSVDDVIEARTFLDAVGLQNTKIFAKLESRQSLLNFKGILNEADGIIISRWVGAGRVGFRVCIYRGVSTGFGGSALTCCSRLTRYHE